MSKFTLKNEEFNINKSLKKKKNIIIYLTLYIKLEKERVWMIL